MGYNTRELTTACPEEGRRGVNEKWGGGEMDNFGLVGKSKKGPRSEYQAKASQEK